MDDVRDVDRLYQAQGEQGRRLGAVELLVNKHEAVCAERYKGIDVQLWWVRYLIIALLIVSIFEPRAVVQAVLKSYGLEVTSGRPDGSGSGPRIR